MLDYVLAIFLIASPFILGFSDDGTAAAFFIVIGVVAPAAHDRHALRHGRAAAAGEVGGEVPAEVAVFEAITARGDAAAAVTDAAWLQAMLDAEAALARALASAGVIEEAEAEAIAAACVAERFDAAAIAAAASGSGNPVVPLKAALTEAVEGPAAAHVHRGATSQDILDTAAMLVAARALDPLLDDLLAARLAAGELARAHRDTPVAGRTLLQQAVPTTFGLKAAGWMAGLEDARRWLNELRVERLAAQLGGAAGTLASLGDAGPAVAEAYADALGLPEPVLPWHTLRGRIGELASRARGDLGRRGEGRARRDPALPDRGRRGARGQGRRVVGDAAQAQPGGGDLRARERAAGARPGGDAARRDGARARARGRRVARRVAAARRAAALDRLGGGVDPRVARGARARPRADAREPRRHRRADAGRAR